MIKAIRMPINDASAWTGADLASSDDWIFTLDKPAISEINKALEVVQKLNLNWLEINASNFPLPTLKQFFQKIRKTLESGKGIALIRGIPVELYELDDLKRIYYGLAHYFGTPVIQNGSSGMMREIRNTGNVRVESTRKLNWHNDRADTVSLLCIRKAAKGGQSRVVSATSIYNMILDKRPDLTEVLFDYFYRSSIDDEVGTNAPYYKLPIFSIHGEAFTTDLSRTYIEQAQALKEVPRLNIKQIEALDTIFDLSETLCFEHMIEPGDIQILNNHVIYHGRNAYTDNQFPGHDRLLLRIWLTMSKNYHLSKNQAALWSSPKLTEVKLGKLPYPA